MLQISQHVTDCVHVFLLLPACFDRYYIKARNPKAAIEMYVAAGKWDEAHKLSNKYMQKEDVSDMYLDKVLTLGGAAGASISF